MLDAIKVEGNRLTLTDTDGFSSITAMTTEKKMELLLSLYKSLAPGHERQTVLTVIHALDTQGIR